MIERACIIGAGIAGVTTALALERAGVQVQLYEYSPELRSSGGTLMLWSNALTALQTLDLHTSILAAGTELEHIEFKSWKGLSLWTMPVGATSRRYGWPCIVLPRLTLLRLLAAGLKRPIRFGTGYAAHLERANGVEVLFQDGSRTTTALLIGADGARSRVREQLFPEHTAFATGQIGWLGHSRCLGFPRGTSVGTLGRGMRFWSAAMGDGEVSWYATVQAKHEVKTRTDLARLFATCHAPLPRLIDTASPDSVHAVEILDQNPLLRWSTARTTLVGDAAHCVRPEIGQGACQALVSAVALASEISRPRRSLAAALRAYENRRRAQTARVQLLARTTAFHIDVENAALCAARDLGVATTFAWLATPTLDWLLSGAHAPSLSAWPSRS